MTKLTFAITKGTWGGAQKYVYELATRMPKGEFQTEVIVGVAGDLSRKLTDAGVRCHAIPELGRNIRVVEDIRSLYALYHHLRKNRPDILHLNSSKMAGLGALAGRLTGVPRIVVTMHGVPFLEHWRNPFSRFLIWVLSYLSALLSHATITISERDFRSMRSLPFLKHKVHLIPIGIESMVFATREEAYMRLSLPEGKEFLLVTTAEMHTNKNLKEAVRAVAHYNKSATRKIRYVILGDGEEREALEHIIEHGNLHGDVILLGRVPEAGLYLKAFDGFLLPSVKEGLPYALLEAGLAGLPAIVTPVGGMVDVVQNGYNGIIAGGTSAAAIAAALNTLVTSLERDAWGARLQETVKEKFSAERMRTETIALYRTAH